eukprot:TRINITY_DN1285_c0_g1_i1.p1 TRINITY_DN1285_c0_g1~~TRINITY_DN1285_c0_g1_i1.p1  ORF type:complete len:163 (+),score=24.87 TRINITY_DN1285_c0_g1_i1:573-1061(+)
MKDPSMIELLSSALLCSQKYLQHYRLHDLSIYNRGNKRADITEKNVLIDPRAEIDPTAKIGPNCIIGEGVRIGPGVRISNSIILDGVSIDASACVLNSIIGWNSIIGSWSRVEGTLEKSPEGTERISILGVGVTVYPEVMIRNCSVLPYNKIHENVINDTIL